TVDYVIKRAGLFDLKLALPEGYRLESVSGTNILQWTEREMEANRQLEVTLKERMMGDYRLRLELGQPSRELPKNLPLAGIHALGTEKLSGFVSASAEPGVAIRASTADGLTEIPAATLADVGSGASFLLATSPAVVPPAAAASRLG